MTSHVYEKDIFLLIYSYIKLGYYELLLAGYCNFIFRRIFFVLSKSRIDMPRWRKRVTVTERASRRNGIMYSFHAFCTAQNPCISKRCGVLEKIIYISTLANSEQEYLTKETLRFERTEVASVSNSELFIPFLE